MSAAGMTPLTAYGVVHYLLRKARGSASEHDCVACDRQADQWAYDHADAFERVDPHSVPPMVFSLNFDHYQPMCRFCHKALDNAKAGRSSAPRTHGTLSSYTAGCRCDNCRNANREYHRAYRAARAAS
jgi:hypothetical protein